MTPEKLDMTAIVLTGNEELHLARCLDRLMPVVRKIYVVDSFSTDRTVAIATQRGVEVHRNPWKNYATQFNWALDNLPIDTAWVLRMDADEYLSDELAEELRNKLPGLPEEVTGIVLPLSRFFLGRHIRSMDGIELLRICRRGKGRCEIRQMDEHLVVTEGRLVTFEHWFADHNLADLRSWSAKHLGYAVREAADLLDIEYGFSSGIDTGAMSEQARKKRQLKLRYARKPLFFRSFAYFLYRYIWKRGFRDGTEGFLWDSLQGLWYRFLVDSIVFEVRRKCGNDPEKIRQLLQTEYKIEFK